MKYRHALFLTPLAIPFLIVNPGSAHSIPVCTDQGAVIRMDTTSPFPVTRFYSIVPQGVEGPNLHSITFSAPGITTPAVPLPPEGVTTVSFSASLNGSEILLPLGSLTCGTPAFPDTPPPSTGGPSITPDIIVGPGPSTSSPESPQEGHPVTGPGKPRQPVLGPRRHRNRITCAGVPPQAGPNWRNGSILGYPCPGGKKSKKPNPNVAVTGEHVPGL